MMRYFFLLFLLTSPAFAVDCSGNNADDTATIQAAINAGGVVNFTGPGTCTTGPINVTNRYNLTLRGDGQVRILPIYNHAAWAQSYGHIFDFSGAASVVVENLVIGAPGLPGSIPASALFFAQTPNGASNAILLRNVFVTGQYRASPFYSYGVPSSQIYSGKFYNFYPGSGTHPAGLFSGTNLGGLTSQFTTITTGGPLPSGNWAVFGTEWHVFAGSGANGSVVMLDNTSDIQFFGGVISGGAQQYVGIVGAAAHIIAHGVTFETESEPVVPSYTFYVYAGGALSDVSVLANHYIPSGPSYGGPGSHP